jgi:hypothetical protein
MLTDESNLSSDGRHNVVKSAKCVSREGIREGKKDKRCLHERAEPKQKEAQNKVLLV